MENGQTWCAKLPSPLNFLQISKNQQIGITVVEPRHRSRFPKALHPRQVLVPSSQQHRSLAAAAMDCCAISTGSPLLVEECPPTDNNNHYELSRLA